MIVFCAHCHAKYDIPLTRKGIKFRCKTCRSVVYTDDERAVKELPQSPAHHPHAHPHSNSAHSGMHTENINNRPATGKTTMLDALDEDLFDFSDSANLRETLAHEAVKEADSEKIISAEEEAKSLQAGAAPAGFVPRKKKSISKRKKRTDFTKISKPAQTETTSEENKGEPTAQSVTDTQQESAAENNEPEIQLSAQETQPEQATAGSSEEPVHEEAEPTQPSVQLTPQPEGDKAIEAASDEANENIEEEITIELDPDGDLEITSIEDINALDEIKLEYELEAQEPEQQEEKAETTQSREPADTGAEAAAEAEISAEEETPEQDQNQSCPHSHAETKVHKIIHDEDDLEFIDTDPAELEEACLVSLQDEFPEGEREVAVSCPSCHATYQLPHRYTAKGSRLHCAICDDTVEISLEEAADESACAAHNAADKDEISPTLSGAESEPEASKPGDTEKSDKPESENTSITPNSAERATKEESQKTTEHQSDLEDLSQSSRISNRPVRKKPETRVLSDDDNLFDFGEATALASQLTGEDSSIFKGMITGASTSSGKKEDTDDGEELVQW